MVLNIFEKDLYWVLFFQDNSAQGHGSLNKTPIHKAHRIISEKVQDSYATFF